MVRFEYQEDVGEGVRAVLTGSAEVREGRGEREEEPGLLQERRDEVFRFSAPFTGLSRENPELESEGSATKIGREDQIRKNLPWEAVVRISSLDQEQGRRGF